jgi:hypothetical protein
VDRGERARGEETVLAAAEVVERAPEEQAELVAQAARAVRDEAKQRREARAKKRGERSGKAARRPEGPVSSAAGFGAVDERLSPPPGWLECFPIRFRLANPAAFDYLLRLLGDAVVVAQALLLRINPPYRDNERMA